MTGSRIVTDYFAAASDDVAALALLAPDGPSTLMLGSGEPLFDTVCLPAIDPFVMLCTLHALLSGRPYRDCTTDARHGQVVGGSDEGPWVVTVADALVHGLADAPRTRLQQVSRRWAATPELRTASPHRSPERVGAAVSALAALSHRAVEVRHTVYCWTQLRDAL